MHNKCNVLESAPNSPPSPCSLGLWKNCLLLNRSLEPERLGTTVLKVLPGRSSSMFSIAVRSWSVLGGWAEDFHLTCQILRPDSILKREKLSKLHETSNPYCECKLLAFYSLATENMFFMKMKK